MEVILCSNKRIIAEEGDVSASAKARRAARGAAAPKPAVSEGEEHEDTEEVLELSDPVPTPKPDAKLASQGRSEQILSEQNGRASCRERVCQYVSNPVVAVSLKKKNTQSKKVKK